MSALDKLLQCTSSVMLCIYIFLVKYIASVHEFLLFLFVGLNFSSLFCKFLLFLTLLESYAYWRLCSLELLQTPPELLQTPLEVFQGPLEQLWAQLELSPAPLELFMLFLSRNIKLRCFCRENLKISLRSRKFGYFQVRSGCLILYLPVRK